MTITINNRTCEAATGQRLLDIARTNHAHIGYFCGGNGICQTCYVKMLEGAELLSPPSEPEKAMLSDRLLAEGTRMACLATIEKPGTITILSAVEEVKQMFETDPLQLTAYSAKMGWEALVKFPETVGMQIQRTLTGGFDLLQIFSDVVKAVTDALQLTLGGYVNGNREIGRGIAAPEGITQKRLAEESLGAMFNGCCRNSQEASHQPKDKHATLHAHSGNGVTA